jgi:hypothetical protein
MFIGYKCTREVRMELLLGLAIAALLYATPVLTIRWLAHEEKYFVIIPENCFAFVVTKTNKTGDIRQGGGGIVKIVHNVSGKKVVYAANGDLMETAFVEGKQDRGGWLGELIFWATGAEYIGVLTGLRTNTIRRFRYAKKADKRKEGEPFTDYEVQEDDLLTEYVPYYNDHAIPVTDAETNDIFEMNFLFNVIEENVYPVKSVLKISDSNAYLAGLIKEQVNAITGRLEPEKILKMSTEMTGALVAGAKRAIDRALALVGKKIQDVTLVKTDMDEKDRELFELDARTERINRNRLADADTEFQIQKKKNDAAADRVERVIKPAAENERTVSVRWAEAHENNKTITTYAPGAGVGVVVGFPGPKPATAEPPQAPLKPAIGFQAPQQKQRKRK